MQQRINKERKACVIRACAVAVQAQCRGKCLEDLQSTTRYVTWSLHTKSRSSLKQMLSRVRTWVLP